MEKEITYKNTEKNIVSMLYAANKPLTTENLAEKCNISRLTAKKYLKILEKDKIVESIRSGKAIYWWLAVKTKAKKNEKDNEKLAYA